MTRTEIPHGGKLTPGERHEAYKSAAKREGSHDAGLAAVERAAWDRSEAYHRHLADRYWRVRLEADEALWRDSDARMRERIARLEARLVEIER